MNLPDITGLRLRNQRITAAPFSRPEEAVGWLAAVQAQDYSGAKWALGLRLDGVSDDEIDRAFNSGRILRTHLLRPTWHFVTPADIRWILSLTAPRVHAVNASMYRKLELDAALFLRTGKLLEKMLQGEGHLTRDELRTGLENSGVAVDGGLSMSYIMMHAELEGVVCSGPRRGKQFTYALLDERAPSGESLAPPDPLAELAGRYFDSRGPATVKDFAKWSGLAAADARRGLEAAQGRLEQADLGGQVYWFSPAIPAGSVSPPRALMLSIYDEYISGYKDHRPVAQAGVGASLQALGNALTYIIVIDGQVVGSWRRSLHRDHVAVELNPFKRLTEAEERAVTEAARRYGEFLGLAVELTWLV
jgi:hypothetical protein